MTRYPLLLVGLAITTLAFASDPPKTADGSAKQLTLHPRVQMVTNVGAITCELDGEKAPATVSNFMRYVEEKFHDGTIFHRVKEGFMIQGGKYTADMEPKTQGLREPVKLESWNGLSNTTGTIAMAWAEDPDSATAQFFINLANNSDRLDRNAIHGFPGYAVFGKVTEGMEIAQKIGGSRVAMHPKYKTREGAVTPVDLVVIERMEVLAPFDHVKAKELAAKLATQMEKTEQEAKERAAHLLPDRLKKIEEQAKAPLVRTESGLRYVDLRVGQGATPTLTDTVIVQYRGTLVDNREFWSSYSLGGPEKFDVKKVMPGWQQGLMSMKEGGQRTLVIPPELGYGKEGNPVGQIPPDATLFFEVELLQVVPTETTIRP